MKLKKTVAVAAAASALAAISVPAMAFENEFHGLYTLKYYLSNYEQGGGGAILQGNGTGNVSQPAGNSTDKLRLNNYFEQRARIFYTAKANDDLKLVTGFEIDSVFGDRAQGQTTPAATVTSTNGAATGGNTGRNQGGAMESDTVNLETKWVYLDFKIPSTTTKVTAGIQPFKDQLKGIFLDADLAGVLTSSKFGPATVNAGYFRAYDQSYFTTSANVRGNTNLDLGVLEAKFALSKDANVGLAYYGYFDGRTNYATGIEAGGALIHTAGLTGDAKLGILSLSGFAAYQGGVLRGAGTNNSSAYLNAFAYNLGAKAAVGPGTLKTALLFTSGNDSNATSAGRHNHYTGWVGTSQSQNATWAPTTGTSTYNESGMMLLNRNAINNNTTTDNAIIYNTSNGSSPLNGQGMYLASLGYDATITPKLYANANAGFAWAAHTNALKPTDKNLGGAQNASNFMGAEVNLETGYKMFDNLTARVQAAYVILGGYYNNSLTGAKDPENPYTGRIILSYVF